MNGQARISRRVVVTGAALAALPALLMGCQSLAPPATVTRAAPMAPLPATSPGPDGVAKAPPPAPPPPLSPFSDAPVSFLVHGVFSRGESVIVRVCLRADRSVESAAVVESSGDARFDQLAIDWARRVQLRRAAPQGARIASCGPVRVELRSVSEPSVIPGSVNLLG